MMVDNFAHLHAHTSIGSMQDAMTPVYKMFQRVKDLGQPALAITDHGTMAAVFDARRAAKIHGVKYIPGCEIYFVNDLNNPKEKRRHLILLAKNEKGYRNLLQINYKGYTNYQYVPVIGKVFPKVDWDILEEHSEGIICLTACSSGPLAPVLFERNEDGDWDKESCYIKSTQIASRLKGIFKDDFYLEIQPHALKVYKRDRKTGEFIPDAYGDPITIIDQTYLNQRLVQMSGELDVPLVATCDVHYLDKEDAKAHDMLMAINEKKPLSDKNRHRYEVDEFYVKSSGDVIGYFSELFNRKLALQACNNSIEIANKCEDPVYLDDDSVKFPKFDAEKEDDYKKFLAWNKKQENRAEQEDHAYMRYKCIKAFKEKMSHLKGKKRKIYRDRMISEIKVFESRNFSSYMLITSDFIKKAKEHGIRVGPGRGSVGGSLVAHLLDIHEVDPLEYGLLFERFINIHKKSFPDIDTDFSPDGRDWVENYIGERYGIDCVAHVSNLSKITPKVVIKDIARSLEIGGNKSKAFQIANEITDSISQDTKTFDKALKESDKLREICVKYPDIEKYGRKLVGLEKTYSTHAAGIVVSDTPLYGLVPLRYDKEGAVSVQYEKERCEQEGLIKMDLLGLEHLKVIDATIANVNALGGACKDTTELAPFDDDGVWDMICKGHTLCVFQLGSAHMRNLCKRIRPRNIEDLAIVNALARPSAAKSREEYIACRDGKRKVTYKHDCIKEALSETIGVCVYEDQLMKFANVVAGWDLNKADGLRKLTKLKGKDPSMVAKLREEFVNGAVATNDMPKKLAAEIWDEIVDPFGGYGFNKPHGIFYSLNGYHTAYYKHHYPAAFMAAALKSEVEKTSSSEAKIKAYKKEAGRMGIRIDAPNVNKSGEYFTVVDEKTIVMGLAAVKGVGITAVKDILEKRQEHEFVSFGDFLYRTNSRTVNKKIIQALAKAGCFDVIGIRRSAAFNQYASLRTKANKYAEKMADSGKSSWEIFSSNDWMIQEAAILADPEWNKKEILLAEGETLGDYVSGSINDLYGGFFTGNGVPLGRIKKMADGTPIMVEAVVDSIKQEKTKTGRNKGQVYGNCVLVDENKDSVTLKIWSNVWKNIKDKLKEGRPIRATCKVNIYKGNYMLVLSSLEKVG